MNVTLTVDSDTSFTLGDDLPPIADTHRNFAVGCQADLFGRGRWTLRMVSAVCSRTAIEVRAAGSTWRQELDRSGVPSRIQALGPSATVGTRSAFTLDPSYFAPGSALPIEAAELWPQLWIENEVPVWREHQPADAAAPAGSITVIDRRQGTNK